MISGPLAVRAVLFDLDGTLIDTVLDLHAAANAMLGDLGRPEIAVAAVRSYVGRGIPNLVKRVLAGNMVAADDPAPPPKAALDSFRHHYAIANGRHALLFPGVREGLEAFRDLGLPLGVITNRAEAFSVPLLEQVGLAAFFSGACRRFHCFRLFHGEGTASGVGCADRTPEYFLGMAPHRTVDTAGGLCRRACSCFDS